MCNRRSGNLSAFVQSFACIEDPVAENYKNEIRTIGNPRYPIRDTVQDVFDDRLYCIALQTRCRRNSACFVFKPVPPGKPVEDRPIRLEMGREVIPQSLVNWSSQPAGKKGHTPEVHVPIDGYNANIIHVNLVCDLESTRNIIGIWFISGTQVVATWKLDEVFCLGMGTVRKLLVTVKQISGHCSNDGKQINILNGQPSCSVGFPMGCCMVAKADLGQPLEWMMRAYLRMLMTGISKEAAEKKNECWEKVEVTDNIVNLIGEFAGMPVPKDAELREGEFSFKNCHERYLCETQEGRCQLSGAAFDLLNKLVGSAIFRAVFDVNQKSRTMGSCTRVRVISIVSGKRWLKQL